MRLGLLAFCAALLASTGVFADSQGSATGGTAATLSDAAGCIKQSPTLSAGQQSTLSCDANNNLNVNLAAGAGGAAVTSLPTNSAGAYSAATVGTTASTVVAAAACKVFCDVVNDSNSATICINLGAVATINAAQPYCPAGEITLGPFAHRSWEGSYVPSDAISAISSAASTAAAVGAK